MSGGGGTYFKLDQDRNGSGTFWRLFEVLRNVHYLTLVCSYCCTTDKFWWILCMQNWWWYQVIKPSCLILALNVEKGNIYFHSYSISNHFCLQAYNFGLFEIIFYLKIINFCEKNKFVNFVLQTFPINLHFSVTKSWNALVLHSFLHYTPVNRYFIPHTNSFMKSLFKNNNNYRRWDH